jgi:hypothetical protein
MRHWGQSGSLRSIVSSSSTIANYWQPLLQGPRKSAVDVSLVRVEPL